ncbi:hypothetical protein Lfu02_32700 [Longispora fulva]|nr:hypothetical protein Lfu02_32700 [Longispora fulva]
MPEASTVAANVPRPAADFNNMAELSLNLAWIAGIQFLASFPTLQDA